MISNVESLRGVRRWKFTSSDEQPSAPKQGTLPGSWPLLEARAPRLALLGRRGLIRSTNAPPSGTLRNTVRCGKKARCGSGGDYWDLHCQADRTENSIQFLYQNEVQTRCSGRFSACALSYLRRPFWEFDRAAEVFLPRARFRGMLTPSLLCRRGNILRISRHARRQYALVCAVCTALGRL